MSAAPIQVRNPEVVRAIRGLAQRTGRPITQVVAKAVKDEARRLDAAKTSACERRFRAEASVPSPA